MIPRPCDVWIFSDRLLMVADDEWCLVNLNTDCPGATSANVRTLGHTIASRPIYPLEGEARRVQVHNQSAVACDFCRFV